MMKLKITLRLKDNFLVAFPICLLYLSCYYPINRILSERILKAKEPLYRPESKIFKTCFESSFMEIHPARLFYNYLMN